MRSIAFADFLIGVGILFVLEGIMFAASPAWMRRAMKSAHGDAGPHPARGRHRLGGRGFDPGLAGPALAQFSARVPGRDGKAGAGSTRIVSL